MTESVSERFSKFHKENPHVADELERMARGWFAAGNSRLSVQMMWEVLRWMGGSGQVKTDEPYRLNDNFRPRYARLLIERNPEWSDRIETRKLKTA